MWTRVRGGTLYVHCLSCFVLGFIFVFNKTSVSLLGVNNHVPQITSNLTARLSIQRKQRFRITNNHEGRDSSAGAIDDWGIVAFRVPWRVRDLSLHQRVQTNSGFHNVSYRMDNLGYKAKHSRASSVEAMNMWSYNSTHTYASMTWFTDNLIFILILEATNTVVTRN